jgi:hypothetical protein
LALLSFGTLRSGPKLRHPVRQNLSVSALNPDGHADDGKHPLSCASACLGELLSHQIGPEVSYGTLRWLPKLLVPEASGFIQMCSGASLSRRRLPLRALRPPTITRR